MTHPTDVLTLNFRDAREALEAAIEHDGGTLVLHDEDGTPWLTLKDASVTETGVVGWLD